MAPPSMISTTSRSNETEDLKRTVFMGSTSSELERMVPKSNGSVKGIP